MFEAWMGDGSPVVPVDLTTNDALGRLLRFYARGHGGGPGTADRSVLRSVLDHVYRLGARTAVIEYGYVDADYRDEHSRFYSSTFRRYPSVAHRLHFFADHVEGGEDPRPYFFEGREYLGYAVMRPVPAAPVGRTVLPPLPSESRTLVMCAARDEVNILGSELSVNGVPFYAQEAQLGRCGQATVLSCAYYHHRAFASQRFLPGEIADAAGLGGHELGRPLPSPGFSLAQLVDATTAIGLPPVVRDLEQLDAGFDVEAEICRYLNSRLPVIVVTREHAFLLVGYDRVDTPDGRQDIQFIRHDDEAGPYQWVDNWRVDDRYGRWLYLIVPLPRKVYLTGLPAETIGQTKLRDVLRESSDPADMALLDRVKQDGGGERLSWRSAVVRSNDYKMLVTDRGLPAPLAAAYQWTQMSRYVWVVELTDRRSRDAGEACVLAEVVVDATDHERDPRPLLWRVPSGVGRYFGDLDKTAFEVELAHSAPTKSVIDVRRPA